MGLRQKLALLLSADMSRVLYDVEEAIDALERRPADDKDRAEALQLLRSARSLLRGKDETTAQSPPIGEGGLPEQ